MKVPVRHNGFTIVELLIVIVVIAILAAITIVAFNGIQTRAENTKTVNAVSQYVKSLRLYKDEAGSYPLTAASAFEYKCLGDVGESCAMISGTFTSECESIGTITNTSSDANLATLNAAVKKYTPSIPTTSQQTMTCVDRTVKGSVYFAVNTAAVVRDYLKGDTTCNSINGLVPDRQFFAPQTTRCQVTLP